MPHLTRGGEVYPVTITPARYNGIYSGALWHAWALRPWKVPREAYGSDTTCGSFWGVHFPKDEHENADQYIIGMGATREEAYEDLRAQLTDEEDNE